MLVKCGLCGGALTVGTLRTTTRSVHVASAVSVTVFEVEARIGTERGHISLFAQSSGALRAQHDRTD